MWIGANDRITEGEFIWEGTGKVVNWWNSGVPDNWGNYEHCVEIYTSAQIWNDQSCTAERKYSVCEKELDGTSN